MTNGIDFTNVLNDGQNIHVASVGDGPLVVFCHGFPGLWYSWRYQMEAVAEAGFKAVALDMRGYGRSTAPQCASEYTLEKVRGDLLAVLTHFGESSATFVGMDFGAAVVWNMALAAPERVRSLIVLGVPYDHDYYGYFGLDGEGFSGLPPSQRFAEFGKESFLHAHYFQEPGIAEAEINAQARELLIRLFWALSAKGDLLAAFGKGKPGMGYIEVLGEAGEPLPWSWMSDADMSYYVEQFQATGFTGALNWYRVCDLNWRANRQFIGQQIKQPCLFIAGEEDPVMKMSPPGALDFMKKMVPNLSGSILLKDAGHFVQAEQAAHVNDAVTQFLGGI